MLGEGRISSRVDRLKHPVYRHRALQVAADAVLVAFAFYMAFRLRFLETEGGVPDRYDEMLCTSIGIVVVGKLAVFGAFGLYEKWWRYFRLPDLFGVMRAVAASSAILAVAFLLIQPYEDPIPRSVVVTDFLLTLVLVGGVRLLAQDGRRAADPPQGPRQGESGARHRRRLGRPDGRARDAAQPEPRDDRGRLPRRQPGHAGLAPARGQGARDHGRPRSGPRRDRARRGHDRDPLRAGRAARQGRRGLPRA